MLRRAADRDVPLLERLAQHLKRLAVELRHLVQKQDALVGQADLAGLRRRPTPTRPASLTE